MALVPATKDGVLCTEGPQPVVSTMLRRWDELLPGGPSYKSRQLLPLPPLKPSLHVVDPAVVP